MHLVCRSAGLWDQCRDEWPRSRIRSPGQTCAELRAGRCVGHPGHPCLAHAAARDRRHLETQLVILHRVAHFRRPAEAPLFSVEKDGLWLNLGIQKDDDDERVISRFSSFWFRGVHAVKHAPAGIPPDVIAQPHVD